MVDYYKKSTGEIIKTRYEIPKEKLVEKGLLPIEILRIGVEIGTTPEKEIGTYVLADKVEIVEHYELKIPTIEDLKKEMIESLNRYIKSKYPDINELINASLGMYDEEKTNELKEVINKLIIHKEAQITLINALTTKEELNSFIFFTQEDKDAIAAKQLADEERRLANELQNGN